MMGGELSSCPDELVKVKLVLKTEQVDFCCMEQRGTDGLTG